MTSRTSRRPPALRLLADAASRLHRDPTDMHADADVAEASAVVFMADDYAGADGETWAAVGRVTRRLLSALGADEALEDEIRTQAAVLEKLLIPFAEQADARAATIAAGPDLDERRDRLRASGVAARAAGPARCSARRRLDPLRVGRRRPDRGSRATKPRWRPSSTGLAAR